MMNQAQVVQAPIVKTLTTRTVPEIAGSGNSGVRMSDNNEKPSVTIEPKLIVTPDSKKPASDSPIIIPSSNASEVMPGTAFSEKLHLDDATLGQLGVKSEDDLADDIELERSPLDGACVVSAVKNGMVVCQYCFLPFVKGMPEFEAVEIQVAKPSGQEQGTRVKVHGSCHLKFIHGLMAKKASH